MQDNVSVLIATIVAVIIIVLFPIYNVATRQDSIANNMVVKATTNFVDEVRNKGYIDKVSYGEYLNELSKTGNIYDVELEVYRPILLESTEYTDVYEENYEIVYTDTVLADMSNSSLFKDEDSVKKSDVYYLESEDKFYVRVKNTNITQAQILLDRLLGGKQNERIVVNYGGIVYSNEWAHGENAETLGANISISRPLDNNLKEFKYEHITDIYDPYLDETKTVYGIAARLSDEIDGADKIKFKLNYKDVEALTNDIGDPLNDEYSRQEHIKDYIKIDGIVVDKEDIIVTENNVSYNAKNNSYSYEYIITLTNIEYDFNSNPFIESKVTIEHGSAYTKSGAVSEIKSKDFIVFYEATDLEIEAETIYYKTATQEASATDRANFARIKVRLNKANSNIHEVRVMKGEHTVEDFATNPFLGTNIKNTYDELERTYITSNIEGSRITENGKYTIYAKDRHGKEAVFVIDIIGLGSDRLKFVLTWNSSTDFDMHTTGIKDGTQVFHVSYSTRSHDTINYGHVWLNRDDTSGNNGGEVTILERAATDMKYTFYIHSFKGANFYLHKPVLSIYRGDNEASEVKIYDSNVKKNWASGEGGGYRYWYILTYDASTRTVEFIDDFRNS